MKILFFGDVVGASGRRGLEQYVPVLKNKYEPDLIICNGENSAHGKGITKKIYRQFKQLGIDVITLGNHAFSKRDILDYMDEMEDLVRPKNLIPLEAGKSCLIKEVNQKRVAVISIMGESFMDNVTSSPVDALQEILEEIDAEIIFVDMHAEATAEKRMVFEYFHKSITALIGTHTHIQTADEMVKEGAAFMSDVGMCGAYDSILGRDIDEVINRSVYHEATRFVPSLTPAMICACLIEIDDESNRAIRIERIQIRPEEENA
ncbi:MAG: TIGR00282 family metallophosphoesterase [Erysipelotrichaceae bacterium]|nr:TIGR00282 family metallophosphoesterase [Erysipelotrichaceae bacterium]